VLLAFFWSLDHHDIADDAVDGGYVHKHGLFGP
jgi:hypothetical protein